LQGCRNRDAGFATVWIVRNATLPDIDAGLRELDHCLNSLSCDGFCLLTNYAGKYLGDDHFVPLFEELNRRSSIVFFHPTMPMPEAASVGLPAASLEFPFDTTRTIASLLFKGVFSRYRNIRFLFAHAGGVVPFLAARLARLESQDRYRTHVPDGVLTELKRLYFDTALSADPYALPGLLRLAAPERILFGSDYPHAGEAIVDKALESLKSLELGPDRLLAIARENAAGLLGEGRV
jgi:6-methylsalicylate decarboxylase